MMDPLKIKNPENPQYLETCPYNESHRIIKFRMGGHIVKCRKAYQGPNPKVVCLFNATHSIPQAELTYHHNHCPDRFNFDKQAILPENVDTNRYPIPSIEVEDEESWDAEDHPSYQPETYCENMPVLRQAKVESASVRKNFRMAERLRIQQLRDNGHGNENNRNLGTIPKFRSTPQASGATNVSETEPYSYEDIQKIIKNNAPKPIIAIPNQVPVFVGAPKKRNDEWELRDELVDIPGSNNHETQELDKDNQSNGDYKPQNRPFAFVGKGRGKGPLQDRVVGVSNSMRSDLQTQEQAVGTSGEDVESELKTKTKENGQEAELEVTKALEKLQVDDDGFIMAKSKKRLGKGRGRGVTK